MMKNGSGALELSSERFPMSNEGWLEKHHIYWFISVFICLGTIFGCGVNQVPSLPAVTKTTEANLDIEHSPTASVQPPHQVTKEFDPTATIETAAFSTPNAIAPTLTTEKTLPVYLLARREAMIQVWQVLPANGSSSILYEVTTEIDKPTTAILPLSEMNLLHRFYEAQTTSLTTTVENLALEPHLTFLTLSPKVNELAWLERNLYCFDEIQCFGLWRLVVLELEDQRARVVMQLPLHHEQGGINVLENLLWSPDAQYLAFIQYTKDSDAVTPNTPIIIDIKKKQIVQISSAVDIFGPLGWSPDSSQVAWNLSRWHIQSQGGAIRFCVLSSRACQDIELEGLWSQGAVDWKPAGKEVIFAATNKDPSSFIPDSVQLYLLDLETRFVRNISTGLDGLLENPLWSPNGELIAAEYNHSGDKPSQSLVVIEPTSGQVLNQLQIKRADLTWVWNPDSRSILILIAASKQSKLEIFDIYNGSTRTLDLPADLATEQVDLPKMHN